MTPLRPLNLDSKFTLGSSLFGAVKLTKTADSDKCSYTRYGIGFDAREFCSLSDGSSFCKNFIIFDVGMSLSMHINDK